MAARIHFPALVRGSTLDYPVLLGLPGLAIGCLLASPRLFIVRLIAYIIIVAGFGFVILESITRNIANRRIREEWARSYPNSIPVTDLATKVGGRASVFTMHVCKYGGFDGIREPEAAVLEDRQSGELIAIHPAAGVEQECIRLGVLVNR